MSLPELLVGVFLGGILLSLLVQLFLIGTRVGRQEMARSTAETAATLAFKRLQSDLVATTAAGTSLSPDGLKLVTHPIDTVTNRRQVVYEDKLNYWSYDSANQMLLRSEMLTLPSGTFDTLAKRLTDVELAGLPVGGTSRVSHRFEGVEQFLLAGDPNVALPNIGSFMRVTLQLKVEQAETRSSYNLERLISLPSGVH